MPKTDYSKQRQPRTPPTVSLRTLRQACGLTLDTVCERMSESLGREFTRGALSAIENGHRGASPTVLQALALAYGIDETAIVTDYTPVERAREVATA